jgi:hypothetical protein
LCPSHHDVTTIVTFTKVVTTDVEVMSAAASVTAYVPAAVAFPEIRPVPAPTVTPGGHFPPAGEYMTCPLAPETTGNRLIVPPTFTVVAPKNSIIIPDAGVCVGVSVSGSVTTGVAGVRKTPVARDRQMTSLA